MNGAETVFSRLNIIHLFAYYGDVLIFAGAVFFAESVILSFSFLAGQGLLNVAHVFVLCFLGTLVSDSFWYWFGISFLKVTHQWNICKGVFEKISDVLDKTTKDKPFLALLFIKFLYGTRFLMTIYASVKKVSYKKFLIYDSFGTGIWLGFIVSIGWLAGKGLYNFIPIYKNISYLLFVLFVSAVLFKGTSCFVKTKILRLK